MSGEAQRISELEGEVARLQAANAELRRVNARLARNRDAKLDAAAAGELARRQGRQATGPRLRVRAKTWLRALALRVLR